MNARTLLTTLAVLALAPTAAQAANFCVAGPCPSGAQTHATLQDALNAAAVDTATRDRVEIGAGTLFNVNAVSDASSPVDIVGAGRSQTTLAGGPAQSVLALDNPSSTVSDLLIDPANGTGLQGLRLSGAATRVDVTVSAAANGVTGVVINGSGTYRQGIVASPGADTGNLGISLNGGAGATTTVEDSSVDAHQGIRAEPLNLAVVRRSTIRGAQAVTAGSGSVGVLSSVIITRDQPNARALFASTSVGGNSVELIARNVTAIGTGNSNSIEGVHAFSNSATNSASVQVRSSSIRGFVHDVRREAQLAGSANLDIDYSNYSTTASVGAAGTFTQGLNSINADPGYVNAAGGDFRLTAASPNLDSGNPAPLSPEEGTTDRDGLARVADGNGDGIARVDIGAFERPAPAAATPSGGGTTAGPPPVTGSGNPPPSKDATAPKTSLASKTVKVKKGRATFLIGSTEDATGSLVLEAAGAKISATKRIKAGSAKLKLKAGKRVRVNVKLTTAAKKLLAAKKKFAARLTLTVKDAAGNQSKARFAVNLRAG